MIEHIDLRPRRRAYPYLHESGEAHLRDNPILDADPYREEFVPLWKALLRDPLIQTEIVIIIVLLPLLICGRPQ